MKLNELAVTRPTSQVSKVFESFFDQRIKFEDLDRASTRKLLTRVRSLVQEHRTSRDFYSSEKNPAYLKLMMMEQALTHRLREQDADVNAQIAKIQDPKLKAAMTKSKNGQQLTPDEQKMIAGMAMMNTESKHARQLKESEVQQAQVVLAAQDMVDQVQGMLEDITELQFKELPALVDSIRNQVGMDQANQFNTDATAALSGLVQNLQTAKSSLESALGVVTGQQTQPVVPGAELGMEPDAELDLEVDAEDDLELPAPDLDDLDAEEEPAAGPELGRKRR
jgi:hypothetical protein